MTLAYQFLFTGIIDYAPVIYNSIYSSIYKVEINTYIQTCTKFSWCYTCIYKETICYDIDKYIYIYIQINPKLILLIYLSLDRLYYGIMVPGSGFILSWCIIGKSWIYLHVFKPCQDYIIHIVRPCFINSGLAIGHDVSLANNSEIGF